MIKMDRALLFIDGEKIGEIKPESFEIKFDNEDIIDENKKLDFNPFEELSFEFKSNFNLFSFYNLFYGYKMTNNYLKMHGGIIQRKRWLK